MQYLLIVIVMLFIGCTGDEKSVSQSLLETCGFSATHEMVVVERKIDVPISIQGYWYFEQTIVELSQADLEKIEKALEKNQEYVKSEKFTYQNFRPGVHLKLCSINKPKQQLEYSLTYW